MLFRFKWGFGSAPIHRQNHVAEKGHYLGPFYGVYSDAVE